MFDPRVYFVFQQDVDGWNCVNIFACRSERKAVSVFHRRFGQGHVLLDEDLDFVAAVSGHDFEPAVPREYFVEACCYSNSEFSHDPLKKEWGELRPFSAADDRDALRRFLFSDNFWNSWLTSWILYERVGEEKREVSRGPGPSTSHVPLHFNGNGSRPRRKTEVAQAS